jgi:hypothetical protein
VGRLRGLSSTNQILFHLGFEDGKATLTLLSHNFNNLNNYLSNDRIQIANDTTNAHSLIGP